MNESTSDSAGGSSADCCFTAALAADVAVVVVAAAFSKVSGVDKTVAVLGFTTCRGGNGGGAFLRGAGANNRDVADQAISCE